MAHSVHDAVANKPETLQHHAEILAASQNRLKVFSEIYRGKGKPKSAKAIAEKIGLGQKAVLAAGQQLVDANMAIRDEVTENGRSVIGYAKNDFCRANRDVIIRLVRNPKRRKEMPTKRSVTLRNATEIVTLAIPKSAVDVTLVTIDDIESFSQVQGVASASSSLPDMSEDQFKNGVKSIIGEAAEFKDWGGESSDLMTTRVLFDGKRHAAAFAFKGPGLKTKLVPGKMGKNGDQCQRLFSEKADLFVVHHWREIDPSVIELMHTFATAKSVTEMRPIRYCVIDGQDSCRLVKAYPNAFETS